MRDIEMLVPAAGQDDIAALRELDADELARYVADPAHPWWRRRPCAVALAGRVPDRHVADLIARVSWHRAGEDVADALADPDRGVAHLAQSLLTDPGRLRGYLDEAPTTEAKLWTAYALHRLTGDAAETRVIDDMLGHPRVEIPGLDDELRSAILHEYAHGCQRRRRPIRPPSRRVGRLSLDRRDHRRDPGHRPLRLLLRRACTPQRQHPAVLLAGLGSLAGRGRLRAGARAGRRRRP
jgi:hypothetical protein